MSPRSLLLAAAILLRFDAAHADPCPASEPFRLSAQTYQGPIGATTGDTRSNECDPIALATSFTAGSDSASSRAEAAHSLGLQAEVAASWGGADGNGAASGGVAEIDDSFRITGVAGPTVPVRIAVHLTGAVETLGPIDPLATVARGSFIIVSDDVYVPGDGTFSIMCPDFNGTTPIACHTTLHGTVPVDEPVYFFGTLFANLHAGATPAVPVGSGSSSASIALTFSVAAPDGGVVELGSTQYLPEPGSLLAGVAAAGALGVSSRCRRARRRSPRNPRPASACS